MEPVEPWTRDTLITSLHRTSRVLDPHLQKGIGGEKRPLAGFRRNSSA
jgi:hypothetical protein